MASNNRSTETDFEERKNKTSSTELEDARAKLEAAKVRTSTWDHYIGFITLKGAGLTAFACAASEVLNPSLIPITLDPLTTAAVGLALLTGKSLIGLIAKATGSESK